MGLGRLVVRMQRLSQQDRPEEIPPQHLAAGVRGQGCGRISPASSSCTAQSSNSSCHFFLHRCSFFSAEGKAVSSSTIFWRQGTVVMLTLSCSLENSGHDCFQVYGSGLLLVSCFLLPSLHYGHSCEGTPLRCFSPVCIPAGLMPDPSALPNVSL